MHVLFQTQLVETIINLVSADAQIRFSKTYKTEMGYLTFVVELGQMLHDLKEKNEAVKECLDDNSEWEAFYSESLKKQIEHRKGPLYDDPRCPKADSDEANFMSRLIGNFQPKKKSISTIEGPDSEDTMFNLKMTHRDADEVETNQEDVDRLIQPFLSFEDDGDEDGGGFEVNDVTPDYDINKYSSNSVRQKPLRANDEKEEESALTIMQRMEAKEKARAKKNRYGGFGMVQLPKTKKKSEVLGVTGVDFDSDEEQEDPRYN